MMFLGYYQFSKVLKQGSYMLQRKNFNLKSKFYNRIYFPFESEDGLALDLLQEHKDKNTDSK